MCGIAGIVERAGAPVAPDIVAAMGRAVAHRGPDDHGEFVVGNVGLAHARLAILDLSPLGHQPMVTDDHDLALSYNGEIYNFEDLRATLELRGHAFHSNSDTEVVLRSWQEWGPDCVTRFNGMFAFAMFDRRDDSVYLVRDRYGIKPLYLAVQGSTVLFGSEQRAIQVHPKAPTALDPYALTEYLTFQNIISRRTLTEGITMVPPGHWVRIPCHSRGAIEERQYWDFDFRTEPVRGDAREYEDELERLLVQAIHRQLRSDVEIGSYLSGGMDSGSITAIAARSVPGIKTFTVGFHMPAALGPEPSIDERQRAELMSDAFGTEQYEMVLKASDLVRAIPAVTASLEEPRVGQSYPNYYAAQLASRFVKVVLSGVGSDEVFGGYPWRYREMAGCRNRSEFLNRYLLTWRRLSPADAPLQLEPNLSPPDSEDYLRSVFEAVLSGYERPINGAADIFNLCLYFDAKTFLPGLLTVEDKLSMRFSLESRVPFLDNDLVDFGLACPPELKWSALSRAVGDEWTDVRLEGKEILRRVMRRILPPDLGTYLKQGFSAPDATWFRTDLCGFVGDKLLDPTSPVYGTVQHESVRGRIEAHLDGLTNQRLLIWSLLTLDDQWS